jgi:hypothetical protein
MKSRAIFKYVFAGLLLAALAGLSFLHEYTAASGDFCLAPENRQNAVKETFLHHLRGH